MAYNPNNPNGSATSANSAPVVIASDQAVIPVTANAGTNLNTSALALDATLQSVKTAVETIDNAISGTEMQVDIVAPIPSGTNTIGSVKITDGSQIADITALTSSNALIVAVVDGAGDQITTFGGGTQYADAAARGTATGTIAMVDDGTLIQSMKGDSDGTPNSNITKLAGTAIDVNAGNASAGSQRVVIASDQAAVAVKGTSKVSIGSTTVMTVTNLQSKANSATAGWQSDKVSNLSTLATDYEIFVKLTTAAGSPANDKAMYIYICPFYTTDGGTTWFATSQGTATLPTGTEGNTTIASPNNLRLIGVLNHTTSAATEQDTFLLSNCFGSKLPDAFSIIIINYSGVALSTSCVVDYTPINDRIV